MNSPVVQVIVQHIRDEISFQDKTSELYLNHKDIAGRSAVHRAMLTYLRLAETMVETQKTVDQFNTVVREKRQAAKKIWSVKTQFRQAAANLKSLLKCQ